MESRESGESENLFATRKDSREHNFLLPGSVGYWDIGG